MTESQLPLLKIWCGENALRANAALEALKAAGYTWAVAGEAPTGTFGFYTNRWGYIMAMQSSVSESLASKDNRFGYAQGRAVLCCELIPPTRKGSMEELLSNLFPDENAV